MRGIDGLTTRADDMFLRLKAASKKQFSRDPLSVSCGIWFLIPFQSCFIMLSLRRPHLFSRCIDSFGNSIFVSLVGAFVIMGSATLWAARRK